MEVPWAPVGRAPAAEIETHSVTLEKTADFKIDHSKSQTALIAQNGSHAALGQKPVAGFAKNRLDVRAGEIRAVGRPVDDIPARLHLAVAEGAALEIAGGEELALEADLAHLGRAVGDDATSHG